MWLQHTHINDAPAVSVNVHLFASFSPSSMMIPVHYMQPVLGGVSFGDCVSFIMSHSRASRTWLSSEGRSASITKLAACCSQSSDTIRLQSQNPVGNLPAGVPCYNQAFGPQVDGLVCRQAHHCAEDVCSLLRHSQSCQTPALQSTVDAAHCTRDV